MAQELTLPLRLRRSFGRREATDQGHFQNRMAEVDPAQCPGQDLVLGGSPPMVGLAVPEVQSIHIVLVPISTVSREDSHKHPLMK